MEREITRVYAGMKRDFRSNQLTAVRGVRLVLHVDLRARPALCGAHAVAEPGLHAGGGPHVGPGYRGEYRDLQLCRRRSVKAAALRASGAYRDGLGKAARRRSQRHLGAEFSGLERSKYGVR